jgi:hypothetical protein
LRKVIQHTIAPRVGFLRPVAGSIDEGGDHERILVATSTWLHALATVVLVMIVLGAYLDRAIVCKLAAPSSPAAARPATMHRLTLTVGVTPLSGVANLLLSAIAQGL